MAAAAWVGGMIFFAAVMAPVLRTTRWKASAGALLQTVGVRFRRVGWIAFVVLILTGLSNLYYRGVRWSDLFEGEFWSTGFGHTLATKLVLVAVVLVASAAHDFVVGPRATRVLEAAPNSRRGRRLRRTAGWLGRLNLLFGLVLMALGVMLVRGSPF